MDTQTNTNEVMDDLAEEITPHNTDNVSPISETIAPSLEQQLSEMKDHWLRAVAEGENQRRRMLKEREDAAKYANTSFARDMVGTMDNLERALLSVGSPSELEDGPLKNLATGIELTLKDLESVFLKQSINRIEALHSKFDPNIHQAVFEIETDEHAPGTVVQVVQSGFLMHDRLLRPAMVGTAKAKVVV